ncbi:MAG TPA: DUF2252 domain-containing protein, partial [Actinomycetota bacterium]|nr:DUF2252 domain-containing protein [Actinomycetota bacterium]
MGAPKPIRHLAPEERAARGEAARRTMQRSSHAGWDPPTGRAEGRREGQAKDSMQALTKLTHVVDGDRRIISDPPLVVPI